MSEIEPPPDELKDLFAAERVAPGAEPSARTALRARLTAAVGNAPLGHAAKGAALGGTGKALATIAIIVAAGAATVAVVKHGSSAPRIRQAPAVVATTTPGVAQPPPVVATSQPAAIVETQPRPTATAARVARTSEPPTAQVPPAAATPPTAPTASSAPTARAVPSEADLLRRAWTALSAGQADVAHALTEQDAQLHPNGALSEERDAVEVLALARLHRTDEARAAGARFIAHYPASVHRARVETAMQNEETP